MKKQRPLLAVLVVGVGLYAACAFLLAEPTVSRSITVSNVPDESAPLPVAWSAAQPVKIQNDGGNKLLLDAEGKLFATVTLQGLDRTDAMSPPLLLPIDAVGRSLKVYVDNFPATYQPRAYNLAFSDASKTLLIGPPAVPNVTLAGESRCLEHFSIQIAGTFEGTLRLEAANSTTAGYTSVATYAATGLYEHHAVARFNRIVWQEYTSGSPTVYVWVREAK